MRVMDEARAKGPLALYLQALPQLPVVAFGGAKLCGISDCTGRASLSPHTVPGSPEPHRPAEPTQLPSVFPDTGLRAPDRPWAPARAHNSAGLPRPV